MPVVNVMSSDVIFVEPETDVSEVVDLLIESKVGAIPVIRPDTRSVVGVVSYIDVLRALQGPSRTRRSGKAPWAG